MQYCSLQHRTLLPSPVTSTTGCCFCFDSIFHSFWIFFSTDLQQLIVHLATWGVHLSVSYLFAFSCCSWGSQVKNTEVVCHSLLQWTSLVATVPRGHKRIRHKLVTKNLYLGGYSRAYERPCHFLLSFINSTHHSIRFFFFLLM